MMINAAALAEDGTERDLGGVDTRERHRLRILAQHRLDMHGRTRCITRHVLVDGVLHICQTQGGSAHVAGLSSGGEVSRRGRRSCRTVTDTLQVALLQECVTGRDTASNDQKRDHETAENQWNRRAAVVGQPHTYIHGATTRYSSMWST